MKKIKISCVEIDGKPIGRCLEGEQREIARLIMETFEVVPK